MNQADSEYVSYAG